MMSMKLHSQWMDAPPKRIRATGGASDNVAILQIMADVLGCPVYRVQVAKSAALGAALRAAHGWLKNSGAKADWKKIIAGFTQPLSEKEIKPNRKVRRLYDQLIEKYSKFEHAHRETKD